VPGRPETRTLAETAAQSASPPASAVVGSVCGGSRCPRLQIGRAGCVSHRTVDRARLAEALDPQTVAQRPLPKNARPTIERRAAGLCVDCGRMIAVRGRVRCETQLAVTKGRMMKHRSPRVCLRCRRGQTESMGVNTTRGLRPSIGLELVLRKTNRLGSLASAVRNVGARSIVRRGTVLQSHSVICTNPS